MSKQFALKHIFCTTTLPCVCHDKFYDSFKQKKKAVIEKDHLCDWSPEKDCCSNNSPSQRN